MGTQQRAFKAEKSKMSRLWLRWLGTRAEVLRNYSFSLGADEESLGFAQRDELSRTYGEDAEDPGEEEQGSPCSLTGSGQHIASPKITTWEAAWNVTNAIQGIFVLGLPYALLQSGYLGLLLLVLAAALCSYTGKILIACLYEDGEDGAPVRVRDTYEDVANACCARLCPRLGGKIVNAAQVVELMMTCILYLVVSSNLASHSFRFIPISPMAWSLVTCLTLLPCMLIRDLRVVSRLSLLCSVAQFFITTIVIVYCLTQAHRWSWRRSPLPVDFEKLLVSVGVIIFSYTSQIFLPTLEGSMADRARFPDMLTWTHALACVFKTTFSLLAFLTWGEETKEVITDNLPPTLRIAVNLCLLAKALLSYPLPFYAAAEVLQGCVGQCGATWFGVRVGSLVLRASLLLLTLLTSMYMPHFSLLMGLTGSMTGAAMTFLLPALFHLQLKWTKLDMKLKTLDFLILVLGSLCSLSGVIYSVKGLGEAFGGR